MSSRLRVHAAVELYDEGELKQQYGATGKAKLTEID